MPTPSFASFTRVLKRKGFVINELVFQEQAHGTSLEVLATAPEGHVVSFELDTWITGSIAMRVYPPKTRRLKSGPHQGDLNNRPVFTEQFGNSLNEPQFTPAHVTPQIALPAFELLWQMWLAY